MTDAARAARILHGIERILDERTTPIPPRVMQQALRVVRGALEGPMTAERRAVEAAIREPMPAPADPPKASWRHDKATRATARRLYEAGMGPTEIARRLGNGLRKQTINDWRKAGGWTRASAPAAAADHSADASKMVAADLPQPARPVAPAVAEEAAKKATVIAQLDAAEARAQALSVPPPSVSAAGTMPMPMPMPAPPAVPRAPNGRQAPTPAQPPALGQLEPVPASIKDAEDWLYEEVVRERGKRANHAEIEARIAMFTPEGLLREVNARRLKHGLPPYVISGRAA